MRTHTPQPVTLHTRTGHRKYLNTAERARFIATALAHPRQEIGTLCLTLAYTGCRISEALALTPACIDAESGFVAIRSLKKRNGAIVIREVPVPAVLLARLAALHAGCSQDERLWPVSRTRAWQLVKQVMADARVDSGPHATPKGCRHGFGLHAVRSGIPLNLLQRWLGHASLETCTIYLNLMGQEEREMASRMWQ